MKPLILEFLESPVSELDNFFTNSYDEKSNLNIFNKLYNENVSSSLVMETNTFTKSAGEDNDSDDDLLLKNLSTMTKTQEYPEDTDEDDDFKAQLETYTITNTLDESTDSDDDTELIWDYLSTMTLTEVKPEATDED